MTINAHAKINTFLKITGHENGYHTLCSRFVKVPHLYDTISFVPEKCDRFTIEGCGEVPVEENTIYKAYQAIRHHMNECILTDFFKYHKVVVKKRIPSGAGLGGGSSDAAAFMRLFNEICKLGIVTPILAQIGSTVGADIPFFVYDYDAANVFGFGEIVEPFTDEEPFEIELYTPDIHCNTAVVYKTFKTQLLDKIDLSSFEGWERMSSKAVLAKTSSVEANDLYKASLIAYPKLAEVAREGWYFSGSGSSFFKLT
ncbi:MAG: 4-(cytidine 5'-diphospho)-2-C-methyl-D-erythritol kinase [Campylobacterales bacterium]|nr:4-(cytidine 5'-diphospho)-2-C-methyl-D-erythritol kinase [Campylobacterales bacterium]